MRCVSIFGVNGLLGAGTTIEKAATRRRNLERRVNRIAPLFADELIGRLP
ncbi:hypothetical protein ECXG_04225 [Escherichia coli TA447]|uniref:Uncharacterized protein n=1 Tax=Escherichia coli TA447 TaxID=656447 RepID=A0A1X3ITI5_ECOLX|nr:hypothetical protein ECXG_04225 [Escherichia coli TA447]